LTEREPCFVLVSASGGRSSQPSLFRQVGQPMSDTLDPDGDPVEGCRCSACRRRRGESVPIPREVSD
jgi:hypothetical protein